jgi:hypothetical protein
MVTTALGQARIPILSSKQCRTPFKAVLPPTAIGKDYPYHGEWYGLTPSRSGVFVSLGGYLGLTIGWLEGKLNFFGGVLGLDIRRPALKLPGLGRLSVPRVQ